MMKREGLAKDWRGSSGSVEPHFDDERTILSAQPVIPLEKVESVQTRRVWMFVAAFVVASLLGSAAALALIKIRQPVVQVATEPEGTEQPVAQAPDQSPEQSVSETKLPAELADETQNQDAPVAEAPKRAPQTNRSTSLPAPVRVTIRTSKTSPQNDDEDEPRLIDQWQERRQRRVNRSKSPGDEHHSTDLFRIREIFEGPRRARRTRN
jgi:hypothetical protein